MSALYSIVAEHPDFLVLDKSAGVPVHREADQPGLMDVLRDQYGEGLHLVHRLDQMTSGLLLIARHAAAARRFGELFQSREIQKIYFGLTDRKPKRKQGWIVGDMEKGRDGNWRLLPTTQQPAVTFFFSYGLGNGTRLLIMRPLTGKTHQLRVAMKSEGAPLLGDPRYSTSQTVADRGYLHATALRFYWQGQLQQFYSPPFTGSNRNDPSLQQKNQELGDVWQLPWPSWRGKPLPDA